MCLCACVCVCKCAPAWARVVFVCQPGNLQRTSRMMGEYLVIQHVYFKLVRCHKKAQTPRDQHEDVVASVAEASSFGPPTHILQDCFVAKGSVGTSCKQHAHPHPARPHPASAKKPPTFRALSWDSPEWIACASNRSEVIEFEFLCMNASSPAEPMQND